MPTIPCSTRFSRVWAKTLELLFGPEHLPDMRRIETICRMIAEARNIDPESLWRSDRSDSQMWKKFTEEAEYIEKIMLGTVELRDQGDIVG